MVNVLYYNLGESNNTEQIVFYIINDAQDGCDTGNEYRTSKVQFNVFSKALDNGDTCENMLDELKSVIKRENLTLDDGSKVIHVKEDFTIPSKLIDSVWQSTVQYNIHIKKA